MKKNFSWISLFGIIALSCNVLSPKENATPEMQTSGAGNTEVEYQDGIPVQEFSLDTVDSIPPEDVLFQVLHFNSGGPGGDFRCRDENDIPYQYTEPTLYEPEDVEFMLASYIKICGLPPNENISMKITYPNNTVKTEDYTSDEIGYVGFSFAPHWNDPVGVYYFEISTKNYLLETNVLFYESKLPNIYYISQSQLFFKNFSVGEALQLFLFEENKDFTGSYDSLGGMRIIIDNSEGKIINIPSLPGSLFVGVDSLGVVYDVIDLNGYSVLDNHDVGYEDWRIEKREGYEQRIAEYESLRASRLECPVNTNTVIGSDEFKFYKTKLSGIELYTKPRLSAKTLFLEKDQPLRITNIYYCYDNLVWRFINLPNASGYIIEEDFKHSTLQEQNCGDIPSRLSENSFARVSIANGNNKNVRKEPGFTEDIMTQLPEGTFISVWKDWCVDNTYWWYIRTRQDNIQGWMTEIQNSVYFLEPVKP